MALAPFFPLLHPVLKTTFPGCLWAGCSERREIALTFDDGPHPQYTFELLEVLDQYQIPASFFWLGVCVERYPSVAQAVYQKGHWLGLHGYYHLAFPRLSAVQFQQDLERTRQLIAQTCRLDPDLIRDVRPPNGLFTPQTLKLLSQWGYRSVMWSVVPEDWVLPGIPQVVGRVIRQTQNGSIIVLHDGYHGGSDVAQSANQIIADLLDHGYTFVTINHLWQTTLRNLG
ncbi:MAG: polysaccharide deacetylase family protein [Oscillatoriales cyanobacterium RM2_1_1]|nr:polysaccharide deacetylase family protein [Oscillatoriales cyanobacterium SM2_3_0]NJO47601.1 polysaccharide deacetylase family protein [Oscillatoriales cyanobacterium RM2_1_1]